MQKKKSVEKEDYGYQLQVVKCNSISGLHPAVSYNWLPSDVGGKQRTCGVHQLVLTSRYTSLMVAQSPYTLTGNWGLTEAQALCIDGLIAASSFI